MSSKEHWKFWYMIEPIWYISMHWISLTPLITSIKIRINLQSSSMNQTNSTLSTFKTQIYLYPILSQKRSIINLLLKKKITHSTTIYTIKYINLISPISSENSVRNHFMSNLKCKILTHTKTLTISKAWLL